MNQVLNRCIVCLRENCDKDHDCDSKTLKFIEKARIIHGYKYNYENVEYTRADEKVKIVCLTHGEFEQQPDKHNNRKQGCPKCVSNVGLTTEEFIRRATKLHDNIYDYSKVEYKNMNTKVIIICQVHGEFEQTPRCHLNNCKCFKCNGSKKRTTEEFIRQANEVHDNQYDYSKVEYKNAHAKVKIICKEHGEFEQVPYSHLNENGCPKCGGRMKLSTEEFIQRAKEVHGDIYDYSQVEYIDSYCKVKISCQEHGEFEQTPTVHINHECGCPVCGGTKRLTKEEFIQRSSEVHNNKYDYFFVDYVNNKTKVKIMCPIHGIFEQIPDGHLNQKHGCMECSGCQKSDTDNFIKKAREVHGNKYDYSKVNYITSHVKVIIICPKHGEFNQKPTIHINDKNGCYKCSRFKKLTLEEFIQKAKLKHGEKYDYSQTEYINGSTKTKIICKKHGIFFQKPSSHLSYGCSTCNESHGEKAIRVYVEENKIECIRQFRIKPFRYMYDCLLNKNILVEFDGQQHFDNEAWFYQEDQKQKEIDLIKTQLALENNYFIVRIPYNKIKQISEILDDVLENPRSLIVKSSEKVNEVYKPHQELVDLYEN